MILSPKQIRAEYWHIRSNCPGYFRDLWDPEVEVLRRRAVALEFWGYLIHVEDRDTLAWRQRDLVKATGLTTEHFRIPDDVG